MGIFIAFLVGGILMFFVLIALLRDPSDSGKLAFRTSMRRFGIEVSDLCLAEMWENQYEFAKIEARNKNLSLRYASMMQGQILGELVDYQVREYRLANFEMCTQPFIKMLIKHGVLSDNPIAESRGQMKKFGLGPDD